MKNETTKEKTNNLRRMPAWDREEVVLLVSEYFRTRNMAKAEISDSIEFVSRILRYRAKGKGIEISQRYRNVAGIEMKFANIQSLDRERRDEGFCGLRNVSILERKVVDEYYISPERINQEAYFMIMKYIKI